MSDSSPVSPSDVKKSEVAENASNLYEYNSTPHSLENLARSLNSIVSQVKKTGQVLQDFAVRIQKSVYNKAFEIPEFLSSDIIDNYLISEVVATNYSSLTVAGVDGGLVVGSLAGVDIIGTRAIGVALHYGNNKINHVSYYPQKHPVIKLIPSFLNFSGSELDLFASLQRSILELEVANSLLRNNPTSIDYLLMDGSFQYKRNSFLTHPQLKSLENKYFRILEKLNSTAKETGTDIAWIVKDTRSTEFVEALGQLLPHIISQIPELYSIDYRRLISSNRDTTFLFYFLTRNSRSFILNRSFKDTSPKELSQKLFSFFLSSAEYDTPLRIDFAVSEKYTPFEIIQTANRLASIILPLSQFNSFYSLPAPIIDADARARISQQEFSLLLDALRKRTLSDNTIEAISLRRSRSPFKF